MLDVNAVISRADNAHEDINNANYNITGNRRREQKEIAILAEQHKGLHRNICMIIFSTFYNNFSLNTSLTTKDSL